MLSTLVQQTDVNPQDLFTPFPAFPPHCQNQRKSQKHMFPMSLTCVRKKEDREEFSFLHGSRCILHFVYKAVSILRYGSRKLILQFSAGIVSSSSCLITWYCFRAPSLLVTLTSTWDTLQPLGQAHIFSPPQNEKGLK